MIKPVDLLAVIGINIIFAGSYLAGLAGVSYFPPLFFCALRFIFVVLILLPFLTRWTVPKTHLKPFFGFCFSMGIGVYGTMYLALGLSEGVSAIVIGTQFSVPIATLLGIWLLGDRVTKAIGCGILLAFVGVMIVGFDSAILGNWAAFLLILVSAFFYAYANVVSKSLKGVISIISLNAWMALSATLPMLVASLIFEDNHRQRLVEANWQAWLLVLYSSWAVSLLGHGGIFRLLRYYPVTAIMPYYVFMPIFGVMGGVLLFDETLGSRFYMGAILSLVGVWWVNRELARRAKEVMAG